MSVWEGSQTLCVEQMKHEIDLVPRLYCGPLITTCSGERAPDQPGGPHGLVSRFPKGALQLGPSNSNLESAFIGHTPGPRCPLSPPIKPLEEY